MLKKQVELLQKQLKKIEKGKNKEFDPKEQILTPKNDIKNSGGNFSDRDNSEQVLTRYNSSSKNIENRKAFNSKDSSATPPNKTTDRSKNNEIVKDNFRLIENPCFLSEAEEENFVLKPHIFLRMKGKLHQTDFQNRIKIHKNAKDEKAENHDPLHQY